jgi:transcriptional regulator
LRGTLDLLVLRVLAAGPLHGWGIGERIQTLSAATFTVNHGSLYPALYRMERDGSIRANWAITENGRRAKYYELTGAGQVRLRHETEGWERFVTAVRAVLREA